MEASFSGHTAFVQANLSGNTSFGRASFSKYARVAFVGSVIEHRANFARVTFHENGVFTGLWNVTLGRIERFKRPFTDLLYFDTSVMDAPSNPYLKRYIDDEQWIASWREQGRLRKVLFFFWELTSHCGRSFLLWMFWALAIATAFARVYSALGSKHIAFNVAKFLEEGLSPDFWSYLYYSIVTFTTLGFGDIVPLTNLGRLVVGVEVFLGYLMLGGLISIFASKFARRS